MPSTDPRQHNDDSGRIGDVWTLWPDRVNIFEVENWKGVTKHDARFPVRAGALPPGEFQALARYIQSSRLLDTEAPQGAKLNKLIDHPNSLLQISVVRGGKRKSVTVLDISESSSAASLGAWAVNRLVQAITKSIEWDQVVGGRVDTGLEATYDPTFLVTDDAGNTIPSLPAFALLDASGEEVVFIEQNPDLNGGTLGHTRHFLLPGTYRVALKKADATDAVQSSPPPSKTNDWVAVPTTIVVRPGRFSQVKFVNTQNAEEKLVGAAWNGDIVVVRFFLSRGVSVNVRSRDHEKLTPLIATARNTAVETSPQLLETVRLLLDKGAEVDARDESGKTALMWAAFNDHADIMRLLLDKGAQVDALADSGRTALMMAADLGSKKAIALLLARKANVNLKNKEGKTALALATDESIKKLLRAAGAK
jgi:hypothetical protein